MSYSPDRYIPICAVTTCGPVRGYVSELISTGGFVDCRMVGDRNKSSVDTWTDAAWLIYRSRATRHHSWICTFQDDIDFVDGLANVVQSMARGFGSTKVGAVCLYTSSRYEGAIRKEFGAEKKTPMLVDMKLPSESNFWGGCGFAFHPEILYKILMSKTVAEWPNKHGVDTMIYNAVRELGLPFLCCYPSLVQHIGNVSIVDQRSGPAAGWRRSDTYFSADRMTNKALRRGFAEAAGNSWPVLMRDS